MPRGRGADLMNRDVVVVVVVVRGRRARRRAGLKGARDSRDF